MQMDFVSRDKEITADIKAPPSLLKWTGSKRSQALRIYQLSPASINKYFEPFLGGGSVLYFFHENNSVCSDIYSPLIEFWNMVKANPDKLISDYTKDWLKLQKDFPDYFYDVRSRFNKKPNGLDLAFLTRTCVNGIVRFNTSGEFNNSLHLSRRGMTPDNFSQAVTKWSMRIKKTNFFCQNYLETLDLAKKGDFVYMDPPYFNNKQRYISTIDFNEFWGAMEKLSSKGVRWAISFDGSRGEREYNVEIPKGVYKHKHMLESGNSAVSKVLNMKSEKVLEALYLNY